MMDIMILAIILIGKLKTSIKGFLVHNHKLQGIFRAHTHTHTHTHTNSS